MTCMNIDKLYHHIKLIIPNQKRPKKSKVVITIKKVTIPVGEWMTGIVPVETVVTKVVWK